ncbi:MAG: hypothetical protein IOD15_10215 [Phycisphaerales bacterium]|nr:hypothetical protein [Phycisphaerales bacterium]
MAKRKVKATAKGGAGNQGGEVRQRVWSVDESGRRICKFVTVPRVVVRKIPGEQKQVLLRLLEDGHREQSVVVKHLRSVLSGLELVASRPMPGVDEFASRGMASVVRECVDRLDRLNADLKDAEEEIRTHGFINDIPF